MRETRKRLIYTKIRILRLLFSHATQQTLNCSMATLTTLENGVKYVLS